MPARPTISACARALSTRKASSKLPSSRLDRRPAIIARCSPQPPAPLYLGFLAPLWPSHPQTAFVSSKPSARRHTHIPKTSPTNPQRCFSAAATAPRLARAISNPRHDDEGNELTITITPRAAGRLQAIAAKDNNPELALRVSVESGGCHGFQYLMSLTSVSEADAAEDTVFENEDNAQASGQYSAKVVMDEPSLELLRGSSVDYTMELIGSQFTVVGIPGAKSSCGCGTSFDIA